MWCNSPNAFQSRYDLSVFLSRLLHPLAAHNSVGGARIRLGCTGSSCDEDATEFEAFACPLWGVAPLLAGGGRCEEVLRWLRGFTNGSNPNSEEFWGYMRDDDQRLAECSAIGFSIAIARSQLWDPLSAQAKADLATWLGKMNEKVICGKSYWLWSRVFANLGLREVGSSAFNAASMESDLDLLDMFYVARGWSSEDGVEACKGC